MHVQLVELHKEYRNKVYNKVACQCMHVSAYQNHMKKDDQNDMSVA